MSRKRRKKHGPRKQKRPQHEKTLEEVVWEFVNSIDAGEAAQLGLYEEILRAIRDGDEIIPCIDEPWDSPIDDWYDHELTMADAELERRKTEAEDEHIDESLDFEIPFQPDFLHSAWTGRQR